MRALGNEGGKDAEIGKFLLSAAKNENAVVRRQAAVAIGSTWNKTLDGAVVAIWENSVIAAEKLGVCRHSLTRCARGERKSAYGYIWEYKEGA